MKLTEPCTSGLAWTWEHQTSSPLLFLQYWCSCQKGSLQSRLTWQGRTEWPKKNANIHITCCCSRGSNNNVACKKQHGRLHLSFFLTSQPSTSFPPCLKKSCAFFTWWNQQFNCLPLCVFCSSFICQCAFSTSVADNKISKEVKILGAPYLPLSTAYQFVLDSACDKCGRICQVLGQQSFKRQEKIVIDQDLNPVSFQEKKFFLGWVTLWHWLWIESTGNSLHTLWSLMSS